MARGAKRFTIYDMMENKGVFEANLANSDSPGYKGPQAYPKMFYSPLGEQRVSVPAEVVMTPFGPKEYGEQRELIWRLAESLSDEKTLRSAGWHDHPAKAHAAAGRVTSPMSPAGRIEELEAQIAQLQAEKQGHLDNQDELESLSPL